MSEKCGHVYVTIIWSLLTVSYFFLQILNCYFKAKVMLQGCTVTYNNNYSKSLKLVPTAVAWAVLHTKKTDKKSPCQPLVRCCHDYVLFKDLRGK